MDYSHIIHAMIRLSDYVYREAPFMWLPKRAVLNSFQFSLKLALSLRQRPTWM